jgi:hypothetical protein
MKQKSLYQQLTERPEYVDAMKRLNDDERRKVDEFSRQIASRMDGVVEQMTLAFADQRFTLDEIARAVSDHKPKN